MLGTIKNGSRSFAVDHMITDGGVVKHESLGIGEYIEYDAHKEQFVTENGEVCSSVLFASDDYLAGWSLYTEEDELAAEEMYGELDREREIEEEESRRRQDANIGGYSMKDIAASVFSDGSHIYYMREKTGSHGRGTVDGFRLTVLKGVPSVEYNIKYDATKSEGWIPGSEIYASKLDMVSAFSDSVIV